MSTSERITSVRGVLLLEIEGTDASMAIELTGVSVVMAYHAPDFTYRSMFDHHPLPSGTTTISLDAVVPRYVIYQGRPEMPDEQPAVAATPKEITG